MKLNIKIIGMIAGGVVLAGSVAYSDVLSETCQSCAQIAVPSLICKGTAPVKTFCGSEAWDRNGTRDCKQFEKNTKTCALGGNQIWTDENWFGAGSTCTSQGDDHSCQ